MVCFGIGDLSLERVHLGVHRRELFGGGDIIWVLMGMVSVCIWGIVTGDMYIV